MKVVFMFFLMMALSCVAKNNLRRESAELEFCYAATLNRLSMNFACPAESLPSDLLTCPFLIMCKDSMPSIVRPAVWKEWKHCAARLLLLLMARWSCSITLLRYLTRRSLQSWGKNLSLAEAASASG